MTKPMLVTRIDSRPPSPSVGPRSRRRRATRPPPRGSTSRRGWRRTATSASRKRPTNSIEAYKLSPAFKLLYNIGQVDVALGRSVEAVDAFDRYLKQGAAAIPEERRREVAAEIDKQLARIGTISIRTFPDGAEIRIDGVLASDGRRCRSRCGSTPAGTPSRPLLAGHSAQSREVDDLGKADSAIEMTLEAIAAPAPSAPRFPSSRRPGAGSHRPPSPPVVEKSIIETPAPASSGAGQAAGRAAASPRRRRAALSSIELAAHWRHRRHRRGPRDRDGRRDRRLPRFEPDNDASTRLANATTDAAIRRRSARLTTRARA